MMSAAIGRSGERMMLIVRGGSGPRIMLSEHVRKHLPRLLHIKFFLRHTRAPRALPGKKKNPKQNIDAAADGVALVRAFLIRC